MYIPNGFRPSWAQRQYLYDSEGRLMVLDREGYPIGEGMTNSIFDPEIRIGESLPPFLAANIAKDRPRRNYYILPTGMAVVEGRPYTREGLPVNTPVRVSSTPMEPSAPLGGMPSFHPFRIPGR